MKIISVVTMLIAFVPSGLLALGGPPSEGGQPNPIASLLPFILMGLVVWYIIRRSRRRSKKHKLVEEYRHRSPTDRQKAYIDLLMEEREVDTWMLEKEPETIQEASELIDELKKRPIRQGET